MSCCVPLWMTTPSVGWTTSWSRPTTGRMNSATRFLSNVQWHVSSKDVLRRKRQVGTMSGGGGGLPGLKQLITQTHQAEDCGPAPAALFPTRRVRQDVCGSISYTGSLHPLL